jgi:hypothetical protein
MPIALAMPSSQQDFTLPYLQVKPDMTDYDNEGEERYTNRVSLEPTGCYGADGDQYVGQRAGMHQRPPRSPTSTNWYEQYVKNPACHDAYFQSEFRRYFGVQWWNYLEILEAVKADASFQHWIHPESCKPVAPIEMLVQTALRKCHPYSPPFDFVDIAHCTDICKSNLEKFAADFIAFASTTLYDVYVRPILPKTKKIVAEESAKERTTKVMKHFCGKVYHETD